MGAVLGFGAVLGLASLVGVVAGRGRRPATLEGWALAGRRNGGVATWFLLGGSIFTAYTYVAVPALVYGVGALGYFAVPYTIVAMQLAFLVLPALWRRAAAHGWLGPADVVRDRFGSPALALTVALTGLLATMPYVATPAPRAGRPAVDARRARRRSGVRRRPHRHLRRPRRGHLRTGYAPRPSWPSSRGS